MVAISILLVLLDFTDAEHQNKRFPTELELDALGWKDSSGRGGSVNGESHTDHGVDIPVPDMILAATLSEASYGSTLTNQIVHQPRRGAAAMVVINDPGRKTSCVVQLLKLERMIIIAFRGTKNFSDMLANAKAWPTMSSEKSFKGWVHSGFLSSYRALHGRISDLLTNHANDFDTIMVTGHSLGGAMATISVPILKGLFKTKDIDCITFGAPRVGNARFREAFAQAVRFSSRLVNQDDPVPKLPSSLYYHHVSPAAYMYEGCVELGKAGPKRAYSSKWGGLSDHFLKEYLRRLETLRTDAFGYPAVCSTAPVVRL